MGNKTAPQERILPIVLGYWQARAIAVATELGVPDLLAKDHCMSRRLRAERICQERG
jgi:hypothetical protein